MENLGTIILATGALGTAAFGIVEALKWTRLGEAGFGAVIEVLGPLMGTLKIAYGSDYERLLRAKYRGDQGELARMIRQGMRVGLRQENARQLAEFLGIVNPDKLEEAVQLLEAGSELPPELRNVLGRFELAVDARIDAALNLAQSRYAGTTRVAASIIALVIALATGIYLHNYVSQYANYIFQSLLVGIAAVPLAPIAKDLVSALQSAGRALQARL